MLEECVVYLRQDRGGAKGPIVLSRVSRSWEARMASSGRPRRLLCAAVIVLVLFTWRGTATAQPQHTGASLELAWDAPEACDARTQTLEYVERLVGSPLDGTAGLVRAHAKVTPRGPGGWQLELAISRSNGNRTRVLDAPTCQEISEAAAVILALALEPSLAEATSLGQEAEGPGHAFLPPEASWHLSSGLGPVLALGAVPSPALGGALGLTLMYQRWRVELAGVYVPEQTARSEDHWEAAGRVDLQGGTLSGCYLFLQRSLVQVGGCVEVESGVIRGQGQVDRPKSGGKMWLATGLSGALAWNLTAPFSVVVEPALLVPWGRPEFVAEGVRVFQPSFAVGSIRLLLEVRFF